MNEKTYAMWLCGDIDFEPKDIFLDYEEDCGALEEFDDLNAQKPPLTWANAPEILTVEELAELLRLSYNTVNEALRGYFKTGLAESEKLLPSDAESGDLMKRVPS